MYPSGKWGRERIVRSTLAREPGERLLACDNQKFTPVPIFDQGSCCTSPPLRVDSARQTAISTESAIEAVEPSIIAIVTMPPWWLREVMAANVLAVALLPSCREFKSKS